MEAKEGHGTEDIDVEVLEPITKFSNHIPPYKGKAKVTKGPNFDKFVISTPLLPEQVPFEGLRLAWISLLKMDDWDLEDHEQFPYLMTTKYMKCIYYSDSCVTKLEMLEWIRGVDNSGFLNLLWVPHCHHTTINTTCVHQFLTLVNDGCLWLGGSIPITDMLIHIVMNLPHEGLNLAKEFCRKEGENHLEEKMKKEFSLIKNPCGYLITSINNHVVQISHKS